MTNTVNTPVKIERLNDDHGWKLSVTMSDGKNTCFGHGMTDRGSKCMLTRRAKQFGLVVSGDVAENITVAEAADKRKADNAPPALTAVDNDGRFKINGVPARLTARSIRKGTDLFFTQKAVTEMRKIESGEYAGCLIRALLRFDDECGNGHNSFAITGEIRDPRVRQDNGIVSCGCIHDEIEKHFPELAHLIKWHLSSTDGPMHYIANTVYHASDCCFKGKRKGEPVSFSDVIQFQDFPITFDRNDVLGDFLKQKVGLIINDFELIINPVPHNKKGVPGEYQYKDKYSFAGCADRGWTYAPFNSITEAKQWALAIVGGYSIKQTPTAFSEGKERDLIAARHSAVWPEATDDQLKSDPEVLKSMLLGRLPSLLSAMKKDIVSSGFYWSASDIEAAKINRCDK